MTKTILESLATTVLLPVYFRESAGNEIRFLRRALESVQCQRFPEAFEILIVDDGSPIPISSYAGDLGRAAQNVRWVRLEKNQGLTYALNRGLACAKFPFIARLDADDLWRDGKIEKQFNLFLEDSDLSISATGMSLVSTDGHMLSEHIRPAGWSDILRFYVEGGCPFPHGSVLARRTIYLELGGYPHATIYNFCEDYALWSTWLRFFKPKMIEEVLYEYTVSPLNISSTHAEKQRKASETLRRHFERLGIVTTVPSSIAELAGILGVSIIQAGFLAYRIWRHGLAVSLPIDAVESLRKILPDRDVECLVSHDRVWTPARILADPLAGAGVVGDTILLARPI